MSPVTVESALCAAIRIATKAHETQTDKGGHPYILHPLRVMMRAHSQDRVVAVLHDVIEDSDWTISDLRRFPFEASEIEAIRCLTRESGETYDSFIDRVCTNMQAMRVKVLDLDDNMDLGRLRHEPTKKDRERWMRYSHARERIWSALERGGSQP